MRLNELHLSHATESYTQSDVAPPLFAPANSKLDVTAFDHEEFIFELKMDGFRALAYAGKHQASLVSRRGRSMKRFAGLAREISVGINCEAVLDGEIAVLDSEGRSKFYDLMRGRGTPIYYCFDILWLEGRDLRAQPLLARKRILRSVLPEPSSAILFADHVEQCGVNFFRLACERDLEGIVAKRKQGTYGESWFKIRNPVYSQYEGRREVFEKRYV
jgi:bifunctional non-homologous end joining protein LigD